MLTVHDAIDDYFEALDFDNENEDLTTAASPCYSIYRIRRSHGGKLMMKKD